MSDEPQHQTTAPFMSSRERYLATWGGYSVIVAAALWLVAVLTFGNGAIPRFPQAFIVFGVACLLALAAAFVFFTTCCASYLYNWRRISVVSRKAAAAKRFP